MARNFVAASSQYLDAGNGAPLQTQFATMTLSVWYKTTTSGTYMQFFGRRHSVWELQFHGPLNRPGLYINSQENTANAGVLPTNGTWHHVLVTYDDAANEIKIYLDGSQMGTTLTPTASIPSSTNPLNIGRRSVDATEYWNGDLAEVAIFNRVVSSVEINALAAGLSPSCFAGLQAYWPILGDQSPEPDLSGNGNNATVFGATQSTHPSIDNSCPKEELYIKSDSLIGYPARYIKSDSFLEAVFASYIKGNPIVSYPELFIRGASFLEAYRFPFVRGIPTLQARPERYLKGTPVLQRLVDIYLKGVVNFGIFERYLKGAANFIRSDQAFIRGEVAFAYSALFVRGLATLVKAPNLDDLGNNPPSTKAGVLSRQYLSIGAVKKEV